MKWLHCESSVKGFFEILKIKLSKTLSLPFNGYLLGKTKNFQKVCSELFLEIMLLFIWYLL